MAFIFLFSLFGFLSSVIYSIYSYKKKTEYFSLGLWAISFSVGLFLLSIGVNSLSGFILLVTALGVWFNPIMIQKRKDKDRENIEQLANIKRKASSYPSTVDEKKEQQKVKDYVSTEKAKKEEKIIQKQPLAQEMYQDQKAGLFHSGVFCPNCRSLNVTFMQNNRKSFSVGKAVGGTMLTGGIGSLAGFAGKKGKNQWFCNNCNKTFTSKK